MGNPFTDAFNASLGTARDIMGEEWTHLPGPNPAASGVTYTAISIDPLTSSQRSMYGGRFPDVSTTIIIPRRDYDESGVKIGDIVVARKTRLRVMEPEDDGSDAITLLCGPVAVNAVIRR